VAVVGLWLATTFWLVSSKILPPLVVGDPPTYRTVLAPSESSWDVYLDDRRLGTTESAVRHHPDGMWEVVSMVRLDHLPLAELTPRWVSSLVELVEPAERALQGEFALASASTVEVDPLGHLVGFRSVTVAGPGGEPIDPEKPSAGSPMRVTIRGRVEGDQLAVHVQPGEFRYALRLPPDALLAHTLAPQNRLPNLRLGQRWAVPVYSPFQSPGSPLEMMHASVDRMETIDWNGRNIRTFVVGYRSDPGGEMTSRRDPLRGRSWVTEDGQVIKQDAQLFSARLMFVLRSNSQAAEAGNLKAAEE
jgi:hypothetical protein